MARRLRSVVSGRRALVLAYGLLEAGGGRGTPGRRHATCGAPGEEWGLDPAMRGQITSPQKVVRPFAPGGLGREAVGARPPRPGPPRPPPRGRDSAHAPDRK